jgi:hypothetical protein
MQPTTAFSYEATMSQETNQALSRYVNACTMASRARAHYGKVTAAGNTSEQQVASDVLGLARDEAEEAKQHLLRLGVFDSFKFTRSPV